MKALLPPIPRHDCFDYGGYSFRLKENKIMTAVHCGFLRLLPLPVYRLPVRSAHNEFG